MEVLQSYRKTPLVFAPSFLILCLIGSAAALVFGCTSFCLKTAILPDISYISEGCSITARVSSHTQA